VGVSGADDPQKEANTGAEDLVRLLRAAMEDADLEAFGELLDPRVTWGPPGDAAAGCTSRHQVLDWYARAWERGGRATVSEITDIGDRLLVGLVVHGTRASRERGGAAPRWQVLTVRGGRITDIVGFDTKEDALAYPSSP
jgi:ketosteroid isomerase-like protein